MKQLRYIGNNQPKGMIVEVDDERVKELLKSGNYEEITTNNTQKEEVKQFKEEDVSFSKRTK